VALPVVDDRLEDCLDALPTLSSALDADVLDIRAAALTILARLGENQPEQVTPIASDVVPLLDPALDDRLHPDAARLVATIADHDPQAVLDAVPPLAAILEESPSAEQHTLVALNWIAAAHPDAVTPVASQLIEYLNDETLSHRVGAIAVLGQITRAYSNVAEETIPTAIDLLNVDHDQLRTNAAGLLADLADEYPDQVRLTVSRAIELLEDSDERAHCNATSILARVVREHPESVEGTTDPLIDMLDDDFPHSRANACWALGYIEANEALDELRERARADSDKEVQAVAETAVQNIRNG